MGVGASETLIHCEEEKTMEWWQELCSCLGVHNLRHVYKDTL